ncbi:nucleotide exchange factor GrpE [Dictyobacter alpinus]|uniref:Protein GrpE n=1 Tax=Dictyobacter alpinus TaxID=2014873 RepID=A0A402BJB0_9CHLR|nr:nucleotide exchange factor GrpE [Dictyobacter alpinus]GCE31431.1 nucleotide exchange factor GrpE [Dictyobacter alpinus]
MQNSDAEQPKETDVQDEKLTEETAGEEEINAAPDAVSEQLAAEQQKSAEYLDLLQRTQADFANFKRRTRQEMADTRTNAQAALIERLLPVLDDLGRVMASAPPELADHSWAQGVMLASRQLSNTLEQLGLKELGVPGEPFDPYKHEALLRAPSTEYPEDTIVQVVRPGYSMGERILRPAQVFVSSGPVDQA